MNVLNIEEAKRLVGEAGPNISSMYDLTRGPWMFEPRTDVAVFQRDAEDGHSYGRTIWYVAYDGGAGTKIVELHDTGNIHDNCHTWSATINEGVINVEIGYGSYKKTLQMPLSDLGLK